MLNEIYTPPAVATMRLRQNDGQALSLLAAQRAIYTRAKRYLTVRLVGMFLIATIAPIAGALWPTVAVGCGAVAGLWIFVGRTYLTSKQLREIDRGAAVQEKFDNLVFGMPVTSDREHAPTLEEIELAAGINVEQNASTEKLRDWYPFESESDPVSAVAICQRANVSYSDSLLRTTAKLWRLGIVLWGVIAIVIGVALGITLETALLIVVLPLLPAFLDLVEFTRNYETASHIRGSTARDIEAAIARDDTLTSSELLVWQERIYELRRTTPLVPNVIYWLNRNANERAMNRVAKKFSDSS